MPQRELAPIAFLAAFSVFFPLPWHWRNGNVATLCLTAWFFVLNMIYGIDAVLWADNATVKAVVWCDITTKLIVGANAALPVPGLCVCVRLYNASRARGMPDDTGMSLHRARVLESMACYGTPLIFMALHYIVQDHRFDILETFGCRPTEYFSVVALLLAWVPPVLFSFISLVLGVLALVNLSTHYRSFITNMRDADFGNLQFSHYVRLMFLALTEIVWVTGGTAYVLAFNLKENSLQPYSSWAYVHRHFSHIPAYPRSAISSEIYWGQYALWYLVPGSTLIFVALFSFGEDPMVEFRKCLAWVYQRWGISWIINKCIPKQIRVRSSQGSSGFLPPLQFHHTATTQNTFSVNIRTLRDAEVQERLDLTEGPHPDSCSSEKVKKEKDEEVC